MLITHTGKLVTAAVTVDLSHCKVEAYFEHFHLFLNPVRVALSEGCIKSGFLPDFPFSFADCFSLQVQTNLL